MKKLSLFSLALFLVPLISAEETKPALDMVYLLVENTFGGVLMTAFGMIVLFIVIGMMSKMSIPTLAMFILLFVLCFGIGIGGALVAFPCFLITFIYFTYGFINWISSLRS